MKKIRFLYGISVTHKQRKMTIIKRTNSDNKDFQELVRELDLYLRAADGEEHLFFAQFNKIDTIKHVVVANQDEQSVGCGAIKEYDTNTMEIKRMYVLPEKRGKGIASQILNELESWCMELGYRKCILETGKNQSLAIKLYEKNNYSVIPNYEQYTKVESSICFEKELPPNIV